MSDPQMINNQTHDAILTKLSAIGKDIIPPGALWTVLLVGGMWYAYNYIDDPNVIAALLLVLPIMLKAFKLGTEQQEALRALAQTLFSNQPPATRDIRVVETPEGKRSVETRAPRVEFQEIEQYKPNKIVRFLLG